MVRCVFLTLIVVLFQTIWVCAMLTVVDVLQSCRWKYDLYSNMPFIETCKSLKGEILREEFSMSAAVDMSMIHDHIPDMMKMVWTLIWRLVIMKSIHYISTVTNCYRLQSITPWESWKVWKQSSKTIDDNGKVLNVNWLQVSTEHHHENEQLFGARRKIRIQVCCWSSSLWWCDSNITIRQHNVINIERWPSQYGPRFPSFYETYIG